MQLYGRGIRRRLPPMLDGDQRRIRLVYSLLFALPGTPVLFYGEEIGLGENLKIEGRLAVRVPMQWTAEPGAGFSTADPSSVPRAAGRGRLRGRSTSTSATSRATPTRSLSFFRHLVDSYRACPELAWGTVQVLDPGPDAASVLAHRADADDVAIVGGAQRRGPRGHRRAPADRTGRVRRCSTCSPRTGRPRPVADDETLRLTLPPYGFRWLRSTP